MVNERLVLSVVRAGLQPFFERKGINFHKVWHAARKAFLQVRASPCYVPRIVSAS